MSGAAVLTKILGGCESLRKALAPGLLRTQFPWVSTEACAEKSLCGCVPWFSCWSLGASVFSPVKWKNPILLASGAVTTLTTMQHKKAQLMPGAQDMTLSGRELMLLWSLLLVSGRRAELEHLRDVLQ